MREAVRRLIYEGTSASVAIKAEPGMGKSLLLRSAVAEASGSSVPVIEMTGDALEDTVPYRAARPALERLLGHGQHALDKALGLLGETSTREAELLSLSSGLPGARTPESASRRG